MAHGLRLTLIISIYQSIDGLFSIGDISITPIPVPHDAREPLQFVFGCSGKRLGILSDLGSISNRVLDAFTELDAVSVEFNHDISLLQRGPYPSYLKTRISGDFGHLNNGQAAKLIERLRAIGCTRSWLATLVKQIMKLLW